MNIAVLFSGQPRDIDIVAKGWQTNLLDLYYRDVFIHTWFNSENIGKKYRASRPEFESIVLPDTLKILKKQYKPLVMEVERHKSFPTEMTSSIQPNDKGFINSIQSMWYSIYKVSQLWLGNDDLKHDWVVRTRFDLKIAEPIKFDNLDPHKLHVFKDCKHTDYCLNDHFAIGTPIIMSKYCQLYVEMYRLYAAGIPFCSETLLGAWIKECEIETAHYPLKYRQTEYV